jgi:CHAT domain-containing protein/Tfp pilus assembly protein PilF
MLYLSKGDYARTSPLLQRALDIQEAALGPKHPSVATTLSNIALLSMHHGRYAYAEELLKRMLEIVEAARGTEHPEAAAARNSLALVYQIKGDWTKAEEQYRRALAIRQKALGPEHPEVSVSFNNLAGLSEQRGDVAGAQSLFERALAIGERALGPRHPNLVTILVNLAQLHVRRGESKTAIQLVRRAAAIQDRTASVLLTLGSDEQNRRYMSTSRVQTLASLAVTLHMQLAPKDADAAELALTTILRRKGRVLDVMTDSFAALRRGTGAQDHALFEDLRSVSAELSALSLRGSAPMSVEQVRATFDQLEKRRQDLEAEVSRRSAQFQAELQPITIRDVQAAIPEGAALVELFQYSPLRPPEANRGLQWGKPRYAAYVLRRHGDVAWADLGVAVAIDSHVIDVRRAFSREAADPRPEARILDALVMRRIRPLLGDARSVFISPDSQLNLVPFGALVDEDGRYLAERFTITYLPSGRDLVRLAHRAAPSRQGAVVIAAPTYNATAEPERSGDRAGERSAEMASLSFKKLDFAEREGRAVARKLAGAQLLLGTEATEGALEALRSPRILHIATHGFFLPDQRSEHAPPADDRDLSGDPLLHIENPLLRSGLALAGANLRRGRPDGVLTALEASQLDLRGTQLVVLSACKTGVGDVTGGEGIYGLRRALTIAGVETQVMTLWEVNDEATRELMEAYYDQLLAGVGRSEALRRAQLAMLSRPERAHPNLWAGFIVSGSAAPIDAAPKASPRIARAEPGPRGCGCELAARSHADQKAWWGFLFALGMLGVRRMYGTVRRARG